MTTSSAATTIPAGLSPAQLLYPDLQQELASTRRMLERVPDGRNDWKPHDKSMSLGSLASHLAELPKFAMGIAATPGFDFATTKFETTVYETAADRVAAFDALAAEVRAQIEGMDWAALEGTWTLRAGPQVYVDGTKRVLLRTLAINHMAHHRAQLGVYLRLLGIAVPGSYGPSADEQ